MFPNFVRINTRVKFPLLRYFLNTKQMSLGSFFIVNPSHTLKSNEQRLKQRVKSSWKITVTLLWLDQKKFSDVAGSKTQILRTLNSNFPQTTLDQSTKSITFLTHLFYLKYTLCTGIHIFLYFWLSLPTSFALLSSVFSVKVFKKTINVLFSSMNTPTGFSDQNFITKKS